MHELYIIISIFVTGGLLFALGLMFIVTVIPAGPLPGNYRKARYMMAGAYLFFDAIYALLLVRYTFLFLGSYRQFKLRMDNYFSDMEAGRLRWVAFSFFAALAIGVMALLSSLFMSTLVALLFAVVFDIFYVFFAIRFINYAHQFHVIERAMDDEMPIVETRLIASLPITPTVVPKEARFANWKGNPSLLRQW